MPELPEVETICRGLVKTIIKQKIKTVTVRNFNLRHPIPKNIAKILTGQTIEKIDRRGKYILLQTKTGTLIIHLGMSGTLQIKTKEHIALKHEHLTIVFNNDLLLCYNDPRRFGAIIWATEDPQKHKLLKNLGLEPFAKNFNADYLYQAAKSKKSSIKQFIMNNKVVTGIGNIYANEVLFATKINPLQKANEISKMQYQKLIKETRKILGLAIRCGGTTIKDHTDSSGNKGSFQNRLKIYGKNGQPCPRCKTSISMIKIGGRATAFCPHCQKIDPENSHH